jgi:CheY-like chemotaxis protein
MSSRKRILIVEREESLLFVWRELLERLSSDYEIDTARNSLEGVGLATEKPFDLIIIDLNRWVRHGVEMTEAIRASQPDAAVIWLTAHSPHPLKGDAARLKVYRCLHKLVQPSEFRQAVQEALQAGYGKASDG